jgi:hypothetical protein
MGVLARCVRPERLVERGSHPCDLFAACVDYPAHLAKVAPADTVRRAWRGLVACLGHAPRALVDKRLWYAVLDLNRVAWGLSHSGTHSYGRPESIPVTPARLRLSAVNGEGEKDSRSTPDRFSVGVRRFSMRL